MLLTHTVKEPRIWLPGEDHEGKIQTTIDIPGFYQRNNFDPHRGGWMDWSEDDMALALRQTTNCGLVGLMKGETHNQLTGQRSVHFGHNVEMDLLVNNMLTFLGSGGIAATKAQYIAIDTITAATTASSILAPGTYTGIPVQGNGTAALVTSNAATTFVGAASADGTKQNVTTPGLAPDVRYGTGIAWSFGTTNVEYVSGATSGNTLTNLVILSYTTTKTHSTGDFVVASPSASDNPSVAPTGVVYSTALAGSTTGSASGIGQRKMTLTFVFPTSSAAGSYTGVWVISTNASWSASTAMAHLSTSPSLRVLPA